MRRCVSLKKKKLISLHFSESPACTMHPFGCPLLLLVLATVVRAGPSWAVTTMYPSSSCDESPIAFLAQSVGCSQQLGSAVLVQCTRSMVNFTHYVGETTCEGDLSYSSVRELGCSASTNSSYTCVSALDPASVLPQGSVVQSDYISEDCEGIPSLVGGFAKGACFAGSRWSCEGTTVTLAVYYDSQCQSLIASRTLQANTCTRFGAYYSLTCV